MAINNKKIGKRIRTDSHAAQVQKNQTENEQDFSENLEWLECYWEKTEKRVGATRDRYRDRQHVVDDQRGAGNQAGFRPQQFRRDQVASAAGRKELDDLRVARRNDEDRNGHQQSERQGEIIVLPKREVRFLRPVSRRAQTVGAQPNPR
jgi:hypothetical protein